jgi:hypothetical protein
MPIFGGGADGIEHGGAALFQGLAHRASLPISPISRWRVEVALAISGSMPSSRSVAAT